MKKICYKRLSLTLMITFLATLVPACFQSLQTVDEDKAELMMGFPFDFYTIKFAVDGKFAIHFNILGFVVNVIVIYFVVGFVTRLLKNIGSRKEV